MRQPSVVQHGGPLPPPWAVCLLCLLTVCATLVAGLMPFHVPSNDVSWGQSAIRFGRYGTALSNGKWKLPAGDNAAGLELWVRPAKIWTRGCILSFYDAHTRRLFRIAQDYEDLILRLGEWDTNEEADVMRIPNVFRRKEVFITVTFDGRETQVYINGEPDRSSNVFRSSSKDLSGQLILANAPLRNQSWSGEIKGLAIYADQLSSAQVLRQYQNWQSRREPISEGAERLVALYRFDEHEGQVAHSSVPSGIDLNFPKQFLVVDHLLFEAPFAEFHTEDSYFRNVAINVAGFVPLGISVGLLMFGVLKTPRAGLLTILCGTAVSLAIEYFQWFLPMRYSGCTDLLTNTLGTWIGFLLCKWLIRATSLRFSGPTID